MKALKLTFALICLCCFSATAQITVNVNTDPKPVPVVRYYYLPEAEAYYDTTDKVYIYRKDGKWGHWKALPPGQAKKVRWIRLSNYTGVSPYDDFDKHRVTYAKRVVVKSPGHKKIKIRKKK